MIQETNTAVGCAVSVHKKEPWEKVYILTCNYATNNRIGCPVYHERPSASGCVNGFDSDLPYVKCD